MQRSE